MSPTLLEGLLDILLEVFRPAEVALIYVDDDNDECCGGLVVWHEASQVEDLGSNLGLYDWISRNFFVKIIKNLPLALNLKNSINLRSDLTGWVKCTTLGQRGNCDPLNLRRLMPSSRTYRVWWWWWLRTRSCEIASHRQDFTQHIIINRSYTTKFKIAKSLNASTSNFSFIVCSTAIDMGNIGRSFVRGCRPFVQGLGNTRLHRSIVAFVNKKYRYVRVELWWLLQSFFLNGNCWNIGVAGQDATGRIRSITGFYVRV